MKSICDQLYSGQVNGNETAPVQTKEYQKACREATQALDALKGTLSPEQQLLLEQAINKTAAESAVLMKQMYSEGVFFGVRLMAEAYCNALGK